MCEMLIQVGSQALGNDYAVVLGAREALLELNVMMPFMAYNFLESVRLLSNGACVFAERCVEGLEADRQRCREMIERSLAMCTSLAPVIGYDRAAAIAKEAYETGRTVREVALERQILPEAELDRVLDPASMTHPSEA
jgi:fumarate hydratase class II